MKMTGGDITFLSGVRLTLLHAIELSRAHKKFEFE
jgi:hypothetical protein